MPKIKQSERGIQERSRELVLQQIAALSPEASRLVDRLRAINASLDILGTGLGGPYALLKGSLEVAEAVLRSEGRWLTMTEFMDLAHAGGFVMDPIRGRDSLRVTTNRNVSRGALQRVGDKLGLPGWVPEE